MNVLTELSWAWRRARTPIRLISIAAIVVMPLLNQIAAAEAELPALTTPCFIAMILGAGMISLDRDRGVLGLILSRPIQRCSYVLRRWVGVVTLSATLLAVQLTLSLAVACSLSDDPLPIARDVGSWLLLGWLSAAAVSAVLTLLSMLLGGIGDACALLGGTVLVALAPEAADRFGLYAEVLPVSRQILLVIHPQLTLGAPLVNIAAAASGGALMLVLAILVMNRCEIPSRGEA